MSSAMSWFLIEDNSPSYIIDQLFEEAIKEVKNAVIESIRTPGEIKSLRNNGRFFLLAVDADPLIRFERIKLRKSETDQIDFQTFVDNEQREMTTSDPNKQNLKKCREMADFVLENNGTIDELKKQIEEVLIKIGKH